MVENGGKRTESRPGSGENLRGRLARVLNPKRMRRCSAICLLYTSPDLTKLNLEDKEFILANGTAADAQKLWAVVQNQPTPVPGVVTDATATVLKISVTTLAAVKPKDYTVKLTTPAACGSAPPAPSELHVKEAEDYITANGVKADTDALDFLTESPAKFKKIEVEPAVVSIKVAVTQDAKDNKTPDFIVNLKEPVCLLYTSRCV